MTATGHPLPSTSPDGAPHDGPHPPSPGLRERKKAATMHRVQAIALDLFAEHGYDAVSIEQVARTAEVSPSTVYRYFGTKEGLVLRDEHDGPLEAALAHHLNQGEELWPAMQAALSTIWEQHFVADAALTLARMRLWSQAPSVRAAGYLLVEQRADELAGIMAATGRWSAPQARILATGIISTSIAALRNWYDTGERTDWREHIEGLAQWFGDIAGAASACGAGPEVPTATEEHGAGSPGEGRGPS